MSQNQYGPHENIPYLFDLTEKQKALVVASLKAVGFRWSEIPGMEMLDNIFGDLVTIQPNDVDGTGDRFTLAYPRSVGPVVRDDIPLI